MPELEFGDLNDLEEKYRASDMIRAVMAWPSDEIARRRYLATLVAHRLGSILDSSEARKDATRIIGLFFDLGGLRTVSEAPSIEEHERQIVNRVPSWLAAGAILGLVRRLATHHSDLRGGASLNKAIFMLDREPVLALPRNWRDLWHAWSTYKSVSHFCAAVYDIYTETVSTGVQGEALGVEMGRRIADEFSDFLSIVAVYEDFGLTYTPAYSNGRALLSRNRLWLLPGKRQWRRIPHEPKPVEGRLLEAARAYRAPKLRT